MSRTAVNLEPSSRRPDQPLSQPLTSLGSWWKDGNMPSNADVPASTAADGVTVLYFAGLRELSGQHQEQLVLPGGVGLPVRELVEMLQVLHPRLVGRLGSVRVAVNENFAAPEELVLPGAVVALIPPVQGG